jgi:hypothetical protein
MKKLIALAFAGITFFTSSIFAQNSFSPQHFKNRINNNFKITSEFKDYENKALDLKETIITSKSGEKYIMRGYHLDRDGKVDVVEFYKTKPEEEFGGLEMIKPPCTIFDKEKDGSFQTNGLYNTNGECD